ncbi:hypothetical protein [Xenophilus sp.]|uniref:hypothetical protein n=1 Tax=Xenophilus sp. TaxID=1873499 RepID=UPI0037DD8FAD
MSGLLQRICVALCVLGLAALASGCASPAGGDGAPAATRSGVEVFGTIDAGVSSVKNKSGR